MMKEKMIRAHLAAAGIYAELSTAKKLKVGCILVKDNRVISIGYNGTPAGWDNDCETEETTWHETYLDEGSTIIDLGEVKYVTKPEVIHAEANAISKLARSNESGLGAYAFITHAPCIECSKLLYGAGITHVFYKTQYRSVDGIDFLEKCNIQVKKIE